MYAHVLRRVAVAFALVLLGTNVDLAFGQFTHTCTCPTAEVIEIKSCQPTQNCQGDYAMTGCNADDSRDCYTCQGTAQTCCATHFLDYQNGNNLCGANNKIARISEDKDLISGEIDARRVFVPICRGTYMSLDQVLGSNNSREVGDAYIAEH
jgi:hypothetical protein